MVPMFMFSPRFREAWGTCATWEHRVCVREGCHKAAGLGRGRGASPALGAQAPGTPPSCSRFSHQEAVSLTERICPADREGGLLLHPHAAELGARPT